MSGFEYVSRECETVPEKKITKVRCQSCDWELTRESIVEELKSDPAFPGDPTDGMINYKFGTLREGHTYFNRGHTTEVIHER